MKDKISKAVQNPRSAIQYIKQRLEYERIRREEDDPESISFYKKLQNNKIRKFGAYQRGVGVGEAQIDFLKRQGVEPSDNLLDIGCGDLRGGIHIIEYLNAMNYTGMDISEEAIKLGWKNIQEQELMHKYPELFVNSDLKLSRFDEDTFDIIFANSVLTHLSKEYVSELFDNAGKVMKNSGHCYFSYNSADSEEKIISDRASKSNIYRYQFETLQNLGNNYGLTVKRDNYNEHPTNQMKMLVLNK